MRSVKPIDGPLPEPCVISIDGAIWFVARNALAALAQGMEGDTSLHLNDDFIKDCGPKVLAGRQQIPNGPYLEDGTLLFPEPAIYRLFLISDHPAAKTFKQWVTEEVLPTLRKNGRYVLAGIDPAQVPFGNTANWEGVTDMTSWLCREVFPSFAWHGGYMFADCTYSGPALTIC